MEVALYATASQGGRMKLAVTREIDLITLILSIEHNFVHKILHYYLYKIMCLYFRHTNHD